MPIQSLDLPRRKCFKRTPAGCVATLVLLMLTALSAPAPAAAKGVPDDFFGVVSQEPLKTDDYIHLAEGHVATLRVSMNWASIQHVPGKCQAEDQVGTCTWTVMDDLIGNAAIAGVRIIPVLASPPSFISKSPKKMPVKGKGAIQWRGFLSAAVERYGKDGHYWDLFDDYGGKPTPIAEWQIWNEPNGNQGAEGKPNAREYAKLLEVSATAIRRQDPEADIVLGGMFGDAKVPLTTYMHRLYQVRGVERYFDTIALHPYAPQIADLKRQLATARGAARRGGDGKARIRITEIGWSSAHGRHPLMKGPAGQAKMLSRSFRVMKNKRKRWNLEGVNWFALQDTTNGATCTFCRDSGLFETNGKAKPAWRAFTRFTD
jgi:hypothetical protein